MEDRKEILYEYAVVRYVPRVDREEFINIGLIMMCKRRKWLKGLIRMDSRRLLAFDPKADTDKIERQTLMFMRQDVPSPELPVEEKYRWLSAVKSAVIQVSPSHPGILEPKSENINAADILNEEFQRLFDDLVALS